MRGGWTGLVVVVLVASVCAGCRTSSGGGSANAGGTVGPSPSRQSGFGAVFLALDECSSFGTTSFTEVPCSGERAAARVVARHNGRAADGPPCPGTTDFVLHISEQRPVSEEYGADGDRTIPRGFACMRGLQSPHPGDPGGGGGPRTIVGDCVYASGGGQVRETACAGAAEHTPEYEVTEAVTVRAKCPADTALYVQLGGERPVGCARPL
ncbi:hypothetical protein ACIQAC_24975 [Streptomyces sp. NPDC088387]|uniref:hypothetical protein n=1 Tax=Streptomyces sp. NPDC088387 TaxID=3365859 RepID=UPI0037F4F5E5